jgi:predicted alpha/beta-fold hydrolase
MRNRKQGQNSINKLVWSSIVVEQRGHDDRKARSRILFSDGIWK